MKEKNINSLIREIKEALKPALDDTLQDQYAWWIVQAITGRKKIDLLLAPTLHITAAQENRITEWINKIVQEHMPLAYLIGSVPFGTLEILVEPPTLIPRPETEEWVLKLIEQLQPVNNERLTILDMCSGSGCIGLALAKALPNAHIYATDIEAKAIALGKKNAAHNGIHNITFIHSDLFNELVTDQLFDMIVSNPPYISFDEFQELDASVATWEDKQALVAADNGTAIINEIINRAADYLKDQSSIRNTTIPELVLEIGYKQGAIVKNLMESAGWSNVKIQQDLEKKDRVVSGKVGHDLTKNKKR